MPGPPPKPMGTKAGRTGEKIPFRVMGLPEVECPELPEFFRMTDANEEGVLVRKKVRFPEETRRWWNHWKTSPLTDGFTAHDWEYLLEVAVINAKFWLDIDFNKNAAELRQRMSLFGVTPVDRAKLRIVTVNADNAEELAEEARQLNAKIATVGDGRRLTAIPGFAS